MGSRSPTSSTRCSCTPRSPSRSRTPRRSSPVLASLEHPYGALLAPKQRGRSALPTLGAPVRAASRSVWRRAMTDTMHTPAVVVSCDSHVGPLLRAQLRDYCPKEHLDEFDAFAAEH